MLRIVASKREYLSGVHTSDTLLIPDVEPSSKLVLSPPTRKDQLLATFGKWPSLVLARKASVLDTRDNYQTFLFQKA